MATHTLQKERNAGIELLRILAILMVISLHRAGHNTLYAAPQFSLSYYVLWFIQTASYKAVDIFFLISGFFGVTQRLKLAKLLKMEFKVVIYILVFYLLAVGVGYVPFRGRGVLFAFFPWLRGQYWYYTAYFSLMLLAPWLNKLVQQMSQKQYLLLLLLFFGASAIPLGDAFFTEDGYSVIWAVGLYLLGGYIRLYGTKLPKVRNCLLLSFLCTAFSFLWFVAVGGITQRLFGKEILSTHFLVYTRVPIVLGAVFALMGFSRINIRGKAARIINSISGCTFGVYLIHSSLFMDTLFWVKLFPGEPVADKPWYWLYVIGTVLLMYVICLAIEWVRNKLFARLDNGRVFSNIADKLSAMINAVVDRCLGR